MEEGKPRHRLICRVKTLLIFTLFLLIIWLIFFVATVLQILTATRAEFRILESLKKPTVTKEENIIIPPIGVMIENEFAARPFQKGLASASIVYEAPTEANITRFLAIFFRLPVATNIGPIRSARPYFADWIAEYGGALVHVGGSDEALRKLAQLDQDRTLINIDEYGYPDSFARENLEKTAFEHTVFSTDEKLMTLVEKIAKERNLQGLNLPSNNIKIQNGSPSVTDEFIIGFGTKTYEIRYAYDPATNRYLRFQADAQHIDHNSSGQIAPKIVVIQRVKTRDLGDDKFRIALQTIGEGDAEIHRFGEIILARWKKEKVDSRTVFSDSKGTEILLDSYPLWIEIVPESATVKTVIK